MYSEDEYLMLSGVQHFAFCRRQWALIHIEQQWEENSRTVDGNIMHERVHDPELHEKRGELVITRAMAVSSARLGISGECDAVELRKSDNGIELYGLEGKYTVTPVEYKRGEPKEDDCDAVQLMAQALCLEDMLCCDIPFGYLYYGEIRRRVKVVFDDELRKRAEEIIQEMHELYKKQYTPKVKRRKRCNACSLKNICLPVICGNKKASDYVEQMLDTEEDK
ncbi:CRISPR-associated protein Cas4 [Ruminococcus flavefaciens]|uniref:CRISPR-associated exonuclease Cas4 n=1 Tax=Ruminococcus flavefaciens TaxID=1265 RepID=A0A315XYX2_RUMFL|nr:CRISPR-associated protein Cas4 [Ruminococcus flavefaciens]PWJ12149.1 CRISPR-associated exonuclease Cas4 [Ruminococcus flavefaciens]SSA49637.1 CRISPR-associated exonuclease Cas4 [Ruminococcus flavefaciens]